MTAFQSCKYIEHGMVLDHCNIIRACNIFNPGHEGRPILYSNYKGEKIDWNDFFTKKNEMRKKFRQQSCPNECADCTGYECKNWDDENYIDYLLLTPWIECNSKCIYCTCHSDQYIRENTTPYSVYKLVKDMIENNVLKKDGTIDFAGGEPTIYPEFKDLMKIFLDNNFEKIVVHTNAINFSKEIYEGIKSAKVNTLVSIDAGTKETHEKIKGVPTYNKVWDNLKKYASAQKDSIARVKTKYIIYPGLNDSEKELKLWLEKSKKIGIKNVVLNLDFNWVEKNLNSDPMPLYNLMKYTQNEAQKLGLICELYGSIFQIKTIVEHKIEANEAGF